MTGPMRAISSQQAGGTNQVPIERLYRHQRQHDAHGDGDQPAGQAVPLYLHQAGLGPAYHPDRPLASAQTPAAARVFTYDANGFPASETDWQGVTSTFVHNARGLQTSRTVASGTPDARTDDHGLGSGLPRARQDHLAGTRNDDDLLSGRAVAYPHREGSHQPHRALFDQRPDADHHLYLQRVGALSRPWTGRCPAPATPRPTPTIPSPATW